MLGAVTAQWGSVGDPTGQALTGAAIFAGPITGYNGALISLTNIKAPNMGSGVLLYNFEVNHDNTAYLGTQDANGYSWAYHGGSGTTENVYGIDLASNNAGWACFIGPGNAATFDFGDLGGSSFGKGCYILANNATVSLGDVEGLQPPVVIAGQTSNFAIRNTSWLANPSSVPAVSMIQNSGVLEVDLGTVTATQYDYGIPLVQNAYHSTSISSGVTYGAKPIPNYGGQEQVDLHGVISQLSTFPVYDSTSAPLTGNVAMVGTTSIVNPSSSSGSQQIDVTYLLNGVATTTDEVAFFQTAIGGCTANCTFTTASVGTIPVTINGISGQTASLTDWYNYAGGTHEGFFSAGGQFTVYGGGNALSAPNGNVYAVGVNALGNGFSATGGTPGLTITDTSTGGSGVTLTTTAAATSTTCKAPAPITTGGMGWHGGASTAYTVTHTVTCAGGTDGAITETVAQGGGLTGSINEVINGSLNVAGATFTGAVTFSGGGLAHAIVFPDPNAGAVYTASQVLGTFFSPMAGTVPAGGAGTYNGVAATSFCNLSTAATASTTFTFADGGTSFGTVAFAASGTTGTFTISSAKAIASGDKITLTAPATADATAAGLNCSLVFAY